MVAFEKYGEIESWPKVYQHWGGSEVPEWWEAFCEDLESQAHDTRYGNQEYLAAKWVVWLADQFRAHEGGMLNFLSVGVTSVLPQKHDIANLWVVALTDRDEAGRPVIENRPIPREKEH